MIVEILNFLDLKEISKSFGICKLWKPKSTSLIANYNTHLRVSVAEFGLKREKFVQFIRWMTRRILELNQIKTTSGDQELSLIKSIQVDLTLNDMQVFLKDTEFEETVTTAFRDLFEQI